MSLEERPDMDPLDYRALYVKESDEYSVAQSVKDNLKLYQAGVNGILPGEEGKEPQKLTDKDQEHYRVAGLAGASAAMAFAEEQHLPIAPSVRQSVEQAYTAFTKDPSRAEADIRSVLTKGHPFATRHIGPVIDRVQQARQNEQRQSQ